MGGSIAIAPVSVSRYTVDVAGDGVESAQLSTHEREGEPEGAESPHAAVSTGGGCQSRERRFVLYSTVRTAIMQRGEGIGEKF